MLQQDAKNIEKAIGMAIMQSVFVFAIAGFMKKYSA